MQQPADERERPRARELAAGALVGRHVVLHALGTGGMGVVVAAYDPELDRKIALKLLRPDLGEPGKARSRLLREAQALAKLAHPNVVSILDVGTLDGQVWLAMEFVQGKTLAMWLRTPRRWREVVGVMRSAGEGLAAAHAAGLLHRDFKPDNVMIGDDGRVRVMDFGLARAQPGSTALGTEGSPGALRAVVEAARGAGSLAEPASHEITRVGAIIGTPGYMAPEQFTRAELTAAADQFAFCVTLWRGLYGEPPFPGRTLEDLARNVVEGRRAPPPTGRSVPSRVRRACERGLAVDPGQRWPSMRALLAELERATAPRRPRGLGTVVASGLAVGSVVLTQWGAAEDEAEPTRCSGAAAQLHGTWDDARRQQVRAAILGTGLAYAPGTWERVQERLDEYAAAWTAKHTEVCVATRVTEVQSEAVMDLRMGCLRELEGSLDAVVKVLVTADAEVVELAVGLAAGLPAPSRCDDVAQLEQQRQRVPPPEDPAVAQEVEVLRELLGELTAEQRAGKHARAAERVQSVVDRAEALGYGPLVAAAKLLRGSLRDDDGQYAAAEADLAAAYALAVEHGDDDLAFEAASQLTNVVGVKLARHAEGLWWGRVAVPLAMRSGEGPELAASLGSMGRVLASTGEYEQAERHHRRALELLERTLGDDPFTATALNNLGIVLKQQGRGEEAERQFLRSQEINERLLGPDHPRVLGGSINLCLVLLDQGKHAEAERRCRRALELGERSLGPDHPTIATCLGTLASVLFFQGKHAEAEAHLRRTLAIEQRALGDDHPNVATTLSDLGNVLVTQGRHDEAEPGYRRALEIQERALGPDHPHLASTLNNLGTLLASRGEHATASAHLRRALESWERTLGSEHPNLAYPLTGLAAAALAQRDLAGARAQAERAIAILEPSKVAPGLLAKARFVLARALWRDRAQRERALALAQAARQAHAAAGEGAKQELAEVERWLGEHGGRQRGDQVDRRRRP